MPEESQARSKAAKNPETGAAAIARVVNEILPPLIGRITESELGEIEVSQDGWRVRLRRDGGTSQASATSPASSGGQTPATIHATTIHATAGHAAPAAGTGQGSTAASRGSVLRRAAVSPAVGYFTARDGLSAGQAVRAGDVLGAINVLGVTQPVVAPTDGVVSRILASAGEAVEYAQELVRIDGIERLVES